MASVGTSISDNEGTTVVVVVVVVDVVVVGTTDAGVIVVGTEFLFTEGAAVVADACGSPVAGTDDAAANEEFCGATVEAVVNDGDVDGLATTVVVGATDALVVGETTVVVGGTVVVVVVDVVVLVVVVVDVVVVVEVGAGTAIVIVDAV